MTRGPLLVLLEHDDFARELYTDTLVAQGFRVRSETQLDDALEALRKGAQLLIAGIGPGSVAVAELHAQVRRTSPQTPLMVILSREAAEVPLRALRDGALEALQAPVAAEELTLGVARCLETVNLFERLPEMHRHVDLFLSTQRLMRAADPSSLARELLDAVAARLPSAGLIVAAPGELLAARGLEDDELRELVAAWEPDGLSDGAPLVPAPAEGSSKPARARRERHEDRVLCFPAGAGPFARVEGATARLVPGMLALRVGAPGHERMWALLFPPPRTMTRKDGRVTDVQIASDLGVLAAQATFALDALSRFPDGTFEGGIDPLTDLLDDSRFQRTLEHEIRRHARQGGPPVGVLVVGLDGLPEIAEAQGNLVAERALVEAARVLQRTVREQDLVARTGPRQLGVLLLGTDLQGAERSAERVRRAFAMHRFLAREGLDLRLGAAVGVAAYPQTGDSALEVRDLAEQAARHAAAEL